MNERDADDSDPMIGLRALDYGRGVVGRVDLVYPSYDAAAAARPDLAAGEVPITHDAAASEWALLSNEESGAAPWLAPVCNLDFDPEGDG
jgi:hypothetical protein